MSKLSALHGLVREHGRETTSFQALGTHFRHWMLHDVCIAYAEVGNSWVTVGGPIGPKERELEAIECFTKDAERRGKRVRFFCLERDISEASSLATLHIGDQPVWDPSKWPQNLSKKLREQLRRARAKGVVTTRLATPQEIGDIDHPTRRGVDGVISRWLESRKTAPMGYLIQLDPFSRIHETRVFVAEHAGAIVGVMVALPIYGRSGWFIDNMLRDPSAPNGTVELMFDCAMRTLAAEGSSHVTLGLSPFVGVSSPLIGLIRDSTGRFYNFKGLYAFKTKLRPASWQPLYLAYPRGERGVSAVFDAVTAFLPGGWLTFVWNTMIQRACLSAGVGAGLLVPFTILLALADSRHWFPSGPVQGAWIALSVVMIGLLTSLARHWRRGLAIATGLLAVTDGALGAIQVFAYNAARAHGAEWLALALSVGLPLFMSTWLWASRNRAQLYAEKLPAGHAAPAFSPFAVPEPPTAPRARRPALINDFPETG